MTRTMSAVLLAGVSALALSGPAAALTNPPACEPTEPRIRCAAFRPGEAYKIIAPPGDSVTVVSAPGSQVVTIAGARVSELTDKHTPKEWQVTYEANIAYFTPLVADIPTSSATMTVRMPDGQLVPHVLELNTRSGIVNLLPASAAPEERKAHAEDTMFMLTFRYPALEAAKAAEEAKAKAEEARRQRAERQERRDARLAQAVLRQEVFYGEGSRRSGFEWRCQTEGPSCGNDDIRPQRISTNGMHMALEYVAGQSIPRAYKSATGECRGDDESLVGVSFPRPDLMLVHGEHEFLCLRRNGLVGPIRNLEYDPSRASNPMTGTTSPRVMRVLRTGAGE